MGAFEWLLEAVEKARIFRRNRVSVEHKVKACVMYMAGRNQPRPLSHIPIAQTGHVAVHYWMHQLKRLVQLGEPKVRRAVAVDETKVNGQHLFVWAAIDVDSREVLAVDASWQRSMMNAEHVLKKAQGSA